MSGNTSSVTRRTYVEASAALLAGGVLAGCTSDGAGAGGSTPTDEPEETSATTTEGGTTASTAADEGTTEDAESTSRARETSAESIPSLSGEATEYLSDARGYADEGPADHTGQSNVEVQNGAGSRGLAFDPPAIAVSSGTTVVWQWTGRGGDHDVVAVDGSFESELVESSSKTFSHTFEEAGEWLYNCSEHEEKGMKGVVVVV